jgi:hypothetical protein
VSAIGGVGSSASKSSSASIVEARNPANPNICSACAVLAGAFRLRSLGASSACIARYSSPASLGRLSRRWHPIDSGDPVDGAVGQGQALVPNLDPSVRKVVDIDLLAGQGAGDVVRIEDKHHPVVLDRRLPRSDRSAAASPKNGAGATGRRVQAAGFSTTPMYGRPRKRWAQSRP